MSARGVLVVRGSARTIAALKRTTLVDFMEPSLLGLPAVRSLAREIRRLQHTAPHHVSVEPGIFRRHEATWVPSLQAHVGAPEEGSSLRAQGALDLGGAA